MSEGSKAEIIRPSIGGGPGRLKRVRRSAPERRLHPRQFASQFPVWRVPVKNLKQYFAVI